MSGYTAFPLRIVKIGFWGAFFQFWYKLLTGENLFALSPEAQSVEDPNRERVCTPYEPKV